MQVSQMEYLDGNQCTRTRGSRVGRCSRGFAESQKQPDRLTSTSSPLISEEDLLQEYSPTTRQELDETLFAESPLRLLDSVSAGAGAISHIMQGRVGSCGSTGQHLPSHPDLIERKFSGEFESFVFNELLDFWGDTRLSSQETTAAAIFPPEKLEWNGASTSYMTSGDPVTATASVEFDRPQGERSCSSSIPPWAETSSEENDLECRILQPAEGNKPWPGGTGVHLDNTLMYHHVPTRVPKSEDVDLHLSSSWKPEISERSLSPSFQSLSRRKTRFYPQPLERSRVQDAAVVEQFTDSVVPSMVSGTRRDNFFQQAQSLSTSISPDIDRRRQAGQCRTGGKANLFTSENLSSLKLKQKLDEPAVGRPAPRKYQRRQAVHGINMEVNGVPTPLDHVQRERQRRDLMTSKIAALELLLPKSSKRDRVSVVYDAIHLLKRLERDVMVLRKRFRDLKERRRSGFSARCRQSIPKPIESNMGKRGSSFANEVVIKGVGKYMKPVVIRTHHTWGKGEESRPTQRASTISSPSTISSAQCLEGNILDRGSVLVEFHVHVDDTVTIQEEKLKCVCRMDYLPVMMGVVDEFRLEVISCNIMKLYGYFTCTLGLKTRRREKTNAAHFAVRLQSVVDVEMAYEGITKQFIGLDSPKAYISDGIRSKG